MRVAEPHEAGALGMLGDAAFESDGAHGVGGALRGSPYAVLGRGVNDRL